MRALFFFAFGLLPTCLGQDLAEPSLEGRTFLPNFTLYAPSDVEVQLFATHTLHDLGSPSSLTVDQDGRLFVTESNRMLEEQIDYGSHTEWILDDLKSKTVADRTALHEKWRHRIALSPQINQPQQIRWLKDTNDDGMADQSGLYAGGFNDPLNGQASGIFTYDGVVFFGCPPNLWALSDFDGDGEVTDSEKFVCQDGFGIHITHTDHGLKGFALGPDGRLYGSMGDQGFQKTNEDGVHFNFSDQGVAFRMYPDGSGFEVLHTGLHNPGEIAFNEFGDAFLIDAPSGLGDSARLIYLVEGADSGWRSHFQTLHSNHQEIGLSERPPNPWLEEHRSELSHPAQPAFVLPPITHFDHSPSGLAFEPGTSLGGAYPNHFFASSLKKDRNQSGIYSFTLNQRGSSYQLDYSQPFLTGVEASDFEFSPKGQAYVSEFNPGPQSVLQSRIISLSPTTPHPTAEETAQVLAEGFRQRVPEELAALLSHPDQRVRLRAQLALTDSPDGLKHFISQLYIRNLSLIHI